MAVRVKICGITNEEDALTAVEAGADALGFVFAPSPRQITPARAAGIITALPPFVTTVGLVVDQPVGPILAECPLDVIQFHGSESPETLEEQGRGRRAFKAFRLRSEDDLEPLGGYVGRCAAYLLDAYVPGVMGGTGHRFPWQLAVAARTYGVPIIMAGGLTPDNVAEAVGVGQPYAVDVSSGVEAAPGKKDRLKVRDFIAAAKAFSDRG